MTDILSIFFFLAENVFFYVFVLLFTLLLLITMHEYGHYIVARWCGVRITKFAVGFGKELIGRNDKNGTRWSLCAIPAGGYVNIFGDLDVENPKIWDKELNATRPLTPQESAEAFCTKSVWQRMAIVLAGPAINFFVALFVMAAMFVFHGQGSMQPIITGIDINSASYKAGFRLQDKILTIDGKEVRRFQDVSDKTMAVYDRPYVFTVLRGGEEISLTMQPEEVSFTDLKGVERKQGRGGMARFGGLKFEDIVSVDGMPTRKNPDMARNLLLERLDQEVKIGLEYRTDVVSTYLMKFPKEFNAHLSDKNDKDYDKIFLVDKTGKFYVKLGVYEAFTGSLKLIGKAMVETYKRLNASFKGKNDDQPVAGVIKMSDIAADSAKSGFYSFIMFLCIFSMQLAIINMLPIPVLDGGYMVFLTYEAIRGKPVPQKIQTYALIIGLVLLGGIMIFANLSDFLRLLH